jgi:hypothetical protein
MSPLELARPRVGAPMGPGSQVLSPNFRRGLSELRAGRTHCVWIPLRPSHPPYSPPEFILAQDSRGDNSLPPCFSALTGWSRPRIGAYAFIYSPPFSAVPCFNPHSRPSLLFGFVSGGETPPCISHCMQTGMVPVSNRRLQVGVSTPRLVPLAYRFANILRHGRMASTDVRPSGSRL